MVLISEHVIELIAHTLFESWSFCTFKLNWFVVLDYLNTFLNAFESQSQTNAHR